MRSSPLDDNLTIEAASPGLVGALATLMASSPLLQRYGTTRENAEKTLRSIFERDEILLVCRPTASESPIGLAWLIETRILDQGAYLRLLLVNPDHHGRGVGARLLQAGEARVRATSKHLYMFVTRDNDAARRFYERHGYRLVGILPNLVRPGIDECLYHKRLRDPHTSLVDEPDTQ